PLRNLAPWCPKALEALVLRCLAKDPAERFASMVEIERALLDVGDELRPTLPMPTSATAEPQVDMAQLADQVAELIGPSPASSVGGVPSRSPAPDPGRAMADLDRALERGALDDATTLLAYLERV